MFHSQRSQMSVRYEIAMYARQRQKFAQQLGVPFRWLRYPCRFAPEPDRARTVQLLVEPVARYGILAPRETAATIPTAMKPATEKDD